MELSAGRSAQLDRAPALAAGCTTVLEHSPDAALDSYIIAEAAEQTGLPPRPSTTCSTPPSSSAPLASEPQLATVGSYTDAARQQKARLVHGGKQPEGLTCG
ncbi:aldehyde dehydrogenase family protein [Nocardia asteroides]|uniref:aldehyde dehydrogenase family protein n=1 Tax=Nocardia asteroides TaxID=1824 RepID=UPI0022B809A3|nr:aldehyde dehydrogenase family protein [Nocardia asteroides]